MADLPPTGSENSEPTLSAYTRQLLEEQPSDDDDRSRDCEADEDPLLVRQLCEDFDALLSAIHERTGELASEVKAHVDARKYNNDILLTETETQLEHFSKTIAQSDSLVMEIEKMNQLRLCTRDFNTRLKAVKSTLKQIKKK